MGRAPRQDDHGGEVYVYRRTVDAVPRLRLDGPDRRARRTQHLLVSAMSAHLPLPRRTVCDQEAWRIGRSSGMTAPWLEAGLNRVVPRGSRILVALVVATVAIGVAIWLFPVDAPLVTLLVPLVVSSLDARAAAAAVVRRLRAAGAGGRRALPGRHHRPHRADGRHHLRAGLPGPALVVPPLAPRRRGHPGRADVRRPARPDPAPGRHPRAPRRVVRRRRAAVRRRHPLRGRLRRHLARRQPPRRRRRRRVRQGPGRRHPGAAAVRAPSAGC